MLLFFYVNFRYLQLRAPRPEPHVFRPRQREALATKGHGRFSSTLNIQPAGCWSLPKLEPNWCWAPCSCRWISLDEKQIDIIICNHSIGYVHWRCLGRPRRQLYLPLPVKPSITREQLCILSCVYNQTLNAGRIGADDVRVVCSGCKQRGDNCTASWFLVYSSTIGWI